MKITIDTVAKTIKLLEETNIQELIMFLVSQFPGDYQEYKILPFETNYITIPIKDTKDPYSPPWEITPYIPSPITTPNIPYSPITTTPHIPQVWCQQNTAGTIQISSDPSSIFLTNTNKTETNVENN